MDKPVFYIAGGSPALKYAGEYLEDRGRAVATAPGSDVTHLLLPVPFYDSGGQLRDLLAALPKDITVLGGKLSHPALEGYRTVDLLENAYYLILSYETFSFLSAIVRGFGTGLMHGMCTLFVGFGISFVRRKRKLFAVGTFAFLTTAITYHAIFNMLIQSKYPIIGALLPIVTYLPFLIWRHTKNNAKGKPIQK